MTMTTTFHNKYLFFLVLLLILSTCSARFACSGSTDYYAQELSFKQRQDFLFYGVQENITSIDGCSRFCYETEFCRSAAYDVVRQRCELAYASVVRCSSAQKNKLTFQPTSREQIIAIYCIDCPIDVNDCFVETKGKALLKAAFAVQKGYSVEECRCICSATWNSSNPIGKCSSFNYFADRQECVLNSADQQNGPYSLVNIFDEQTAYHEFVCVNDQTLAVQFATTVCSRISAKFETSKDDTCFEEFPGYILNTLAGALEHNVTFERCKCLCATSDVAGKYNFPCKSILYYTVEKDCILNAGNRLDRPDLFRRDSSSYKIVYSGVTCDGELAKKFVDGKCKDGKSSSVDTVLNGNSVTDQPLSVGKPSVRFEDNSKRPVPGDKTDACFLEISHYLLSGQATALETNLTMEQCKCLCASSKLKYGFVCLSIQYYSDLKTCLLNRRNRLQEPSLFVKSLVEDKPLSYFDFLCAEDEDKINSYKRSVCIFETTTPTAISTTVSFFQSNFETTNSLVTTETTPSTLKATTPNGQNLDTGSTATVEPVIASCRYSTFYDSKFDGRKLIERTVVNDASGCFQNCYQKHCKSANLQNFLGKYKYCEIFKDSAVDYPSVNYLTYSSDSVYFEGIQCQQNVDRRHQLSFWFR